MSITTMTPTSAMRPANRPAPVRAAARPAAKPAARPASTGIGAGTLWALWLGSVILIVTAALLH